MTSPTVPIPQPPPKPVVGNLPDIDTSKGVLGMVEVAERYGPIVRFQFFNRSVVAVSSQRLVNEVCDESRFDKVLGNALREVRDFIGDGLFTAETQEPNWQKAHRILMPAFGPAALKRMFSGMDDIAEQLLLKWERLGPTVRIDVPDNTTRLTLDTIALCSFSYRFNGLYREELHPFVGAMVRSLIESGQRGRRLPVQNKVMLRRRHQLEEDNALMFEVADQMISDRRRNPSPPGSEDILDTMLNAADPRQVSGCPRTTSASSDLVQRALTRFNLDYDAHVLLSMEQGDTFLPTDMPVSVGELLSSYVELAVPATRIQLEYLADVAEDPVQRRELESLAEDRERHAADILDKRVSLLDLLETYPSCQLSFSSFLQLLTQLSPRRYSISSSPLWSPDHATLTFTVIQAPAWSGRGVFEGAPSTYLAQARPGSRVAVTVRPSNAAFHPSESLDVPLIMVCAGTGLAPFRGFVQDRALRAEAEGIKPAPALLFFGCRSPDTDFLYQTVLASWAGQANLDLRPVFSTAPEDGRKYVQDRLWADRADVVELVKQGATVYVCGDGKHMAFSVAGFSVTV